MIIQLLATEGGSIATVEVPEEPEENTVLILPKEAQLAGLWINGLDLPDGTIAIFVIRRLTYATSIYGYIGPMFSYRAATEEEFLNSGSTTLNAGGI